ncbi:MAG: TonB-dependent receptor [Cytophagales bacterium]|nr:TonB-dependent receptor [Cytophagales bacterium]
MLFVTLLLLYISVPVCATKLYPATTSNDTLKVENNDLFNMSLEDIMNMKVSTTSRTEVQNSNDAPATIRVISADMIYKRGYISLLDVVRDLPEFKVDFGVDPRWMNDITLRGIRGMDKFVILMDGVRISSPTNDIIAVMENYPVHMAKQVEVVYGPASALYGADAFAGVINIITKKSMAVENKELSVNGMLRAGMYNTYIGNIHISQKINDKVEINAGGQYFFDKQPPMENFYKEEWGKTDSILKSGTFPTIFGPMKPIATIDPTKSNDLKAHAAYINIYIKNFKISYFRNHGRLPSTQANSPANSVYNDASFFGHYINNVNISYSKNVGGKLGLSSFLIFNRYDLDSKSNFRNTYTNMEPAYLYAYGWMGKAEQLASYKISSKFDITAGATYEYYTSVPRSNNLQFPLTGDVQAGILVNSIDPIQSSNGIAVDLTKISYQNIGVLAQLVIKPLPNLMITAGVRNDMYIYAKPEDKYISNASSRTLNTLNPRLGIVFNPSKILTLKAMGGSAFLAPSPQNMFDRYGTFNFNNSGTSLPPVYSFFFQLPNANLKPQKLYTLEFTARVRPTPNVSIGVTPFYTHIVDLISPVSDTNRIKTIYPDKTYAGYPIIGGIQINDNLGTQNVYGLTFDTDFLINISNIINLVPYFNISIIDGTIDIDDNGPQQARNLSGVSPFSSKIGVTANISKLSISLNTSIYGKQRTFGVGSVQNNDPLKYQELDGFVLVNALANYRLHKYLSVFVQGSNILDQRYRNVNIGAAPQSSGAGSAAVEFATGMPQYPIRLQAGVVYNVK